MVELKSSFSLDLNLSRVQLFLPPERRTECSRRRSHVSVGSTWTFRRHLDGRCELLHYDLLALAVPERFNQTRFKHSPQKTTWNVRIFKSMTTALI